MLRNLVPLGLTTLLLCSVTSSSLANRGAKKPEPSRRAARTSDPASESLRTPAAQKRIAPRARTRARTGAKQRAVRRARAAVVSHSLLRPSWTIADLNPMPQLLDLDDTARDLRLATARILDMIKR